MRLTTHGEPCIKNSNFEEEYPMSDTTSTLISAGGKLTRQELVLVPTPLGTTTHKIIPHAEVIEALVETLGFRHIGVVSEEYAVSRDGMKMFGVLDLDTGMHGCRFSIGEERPRQEHAAGDDCRLPRVRVREHGLLWRL